MLLQQPQHLTVGPHCARRAQGTRENMACAFVTGLHRVTLQWLYSIASKAPPSPPTTYCFSTYPAVNANYRNPPLCRACAPYISSVFAGVYNLDLCLSACCTQPLPGCLLHHQFIRAGGDPAPEGRSMATPALRRHLGAAQRRSPPVNPPPGDASSYKEFSSTAQSLRAHALDKTLFVSFLTTVIYSSRR